MNRSTTAAVIISAGISGIFRQILPYTKETNINMNIQGERASGKSTICHFVLSFFGNPEFLEGSFTDTDNAMEIIRAQRPVMPYILDERMLKVEGASEENKKKTLLLDIFREYEGRVKERVGKQYEDVSGKRTCSPIISSSVEPMLNYVLDNSDLGQFRRFIEINLNGGELFQSDRELAEAVENISYTCYGYGIEMLINYILDKNYENGAYIEELFKEYSNVIGEILTEKEKSENVRGLISSTKRFALIAVSYHILYEALLDYFDGQRAGKLTIIMKAKEIIDYLVCNIIEKMKKVKVDFSIRQNIIKFITLHQGLFYQNSKKWTGDGKYLGWLQETNENYYIYVKKGFNLEWVIALGAENEDDALVKYIEMCEEYSSNKSAKQLKEAFHQLAGTPHRKSFKECVKENDKVQYSDDNSDSDLRVGSVRYNRITVAKKDFDGTGKEKEDTKE